jgi:hypothetical protein
MARKKERKKERKERVTPSLRDKRERAGLCPTVARESFSKRFLDFFAIE